MSLQRLPLWTILLVIVLGLSLQVWYWAQLPEQMAIHFGPDGKANQWMSRAGATVLSCGLVVGLPLFFSIIPIAIRRLPTSTINIPYREYWLAPERREATLDWISGFMFWFAAGIAVFIVAINHLTFLANRDAKPLPMLPFWIALALFLGATFVGVAMTWRRFPKPAKAV